MCALAFAAPEEEKGRMLLKTAIGLDERGTKSGWAEAGAKAQAIEAYVEAAEVQLTDRCPPETIYDLRDTEPALGSNGFH